MTESGTTIEETIAILETYGRVYHLDHALRSSAYRVSGEWSNYEASGYSDIQAVIALRVKVYNLMRVQTRFVEKMRDSESW